ncbi:MAG: hypothetical protein ABUT20_22990 [Bacteroidota bacterium]
MTDIEYHEIEFTTWECNKANANETCAELDATTRVHSVLDPCTKEKIGLFFQHTTKLFSSKGIILNCIAEHVFISPAIFCYCFTQMKELVETAHQRFKDKLLERSFVEEVPVTLNCVVNDFEVEQVMLQLK